MIDSAVDFAKKKGGSLDQQVDDALDRLLVEFGREILQIIPGKVSTEVDARFSFDTQASVNKALQIIQVRPGTSGHFGAILVTPVKNSVLICHI